MRQIYDVVTKETLNLDRRLIKQLNLPSGIHHLWSRRRLKHIAGRYILPENKDKIFTLVDIDTGIEYDCIANKTIFLYFNLPYNEVEAKSIYSLVKKKQSYLSICGKVVYLKKHGYPLVIRRTDSKYPSIKLDNLGQRTKLKNKIYRVLLRRIHHALTRTKKSNRTEELLGCTIQFFMGYIESKFTKSMTWQNQGEWHFDHIKQCATFDLYSVDEQRKCFHYTNIRPLWATTEIAVKYGENSDYIGNLNRNKDMIN